MGTPDVRLVAPTGMAPDPDLYPGATLTDDLARGLDGADVIMALRIQRERLPNEGSQISAADYHAKYGINARRLERAEPDAIVMHPGPMNRDVEIAGDIADGPHSVIVDQVTNGLAMRMAVLTMVMESRRDR
ncbi:MAG: aspartate carbamoyltransferase catalytic subunit, partial [Gammaproteobacteria bacterium]